MATEKTTTRPTPAQRARQAEAALTALQAEHDAFKTRVRDTAIKYATEHDWCHVIDDALIEMKLEPRSNDDESQVTMTFQVSFRAIANDPEYVHDEDNMIESLTAEDTIVKMAEAVKDALGRMLIHEDIFATPTSDKRGWRLAEDVKLTSGDAEVDVIDPEMRPFRW